MSRGPYLTAGTIAVSCALLFGLAAVPAAAQAVRQNAFVLLIGADTLAVENVSRTPATLEGELVGRATGRMVYSLTLGPAGTVRELTLSAWMPGRTGEAAPVQEARLTLSGDSVLVEVTGDAGSRTQRIATRPGALPYLNPSFALMEQVLVRARALGGTSAVVPLFFVQGGQTVDATVTWATADSATVTIAGSEMHLATSPDGELLYAGVPAQGLTATRVAGRHLAPPALDPPDYSAPEGAPYVAEHVTVPTPDGHTLAGTLTLPAGSALAPAVITITGSGAQDRDQALPILPGYRPFREIADTLSRRGIAVLRLDDRGFGESTGTFATATSADLAEDIRAALAYLRSRSDIDEARLGLVGHSEGGLIAPQVAATDTSLAAIVLIAGPARTGREIIDYQQRSAIASSPALTEAERDSAYQAAQQQLEQTAATSPWLRHFLLYDPLPTATQVRHTPVLVLHGETDRQVTVAQARELGASFRAGGNPDVTVRVFPDINHLLLHDPDGDPAKYMRLKDREIAPEVVGVLVEWLAARLH